MTTYSTPGDSSIEQLMKTLEQAFSKPYSTQQKSGYDYDIHKHTGKNVDEVAEAIKNALPNPVPSEEVARLLPERGVDLANIAWPPVQSTINLFRRHLNSIVQQAHAKGVPVETLTEVFEDRINNLSLEEKPYMEGLIDSYQTETAPIVKRFVDEMAPHLDTLIRDMAKFQPQFIALIAELLVFSANYTPGNDTTA